RPGPAGPGREAADHEDGGRDAGEQPRGAPPGAQLDRAVRGRLEQLPDQRLARVERLGEVGPPGLQQARQFVPDGGRLAPAYGVEQGVVGSDLGQVVLGAHAALTSPNSSPAIDRSRARARDWATRTAAADRPTTTPTSSADKPTATRNNTISRCVSVSRSRSPESRRARSVLTACCSGPGAASGGSTRCSTGATTASRTAVRCASATLWAAMPYTKAVKGRPWSRYLGRAPNKAKQTSWATSSAVAYAPPTRPSRARQ